MGKLIKLNDEQQKINYENIIHRIETDLRKLYKIAFVYAFKDEFLRFIDNSIKNDHDYHSKDDKQEENISVRRKMQKRDNYDNTEAYVIDYFGTYDLQAYNKELKYVSENRDVFIKKHDICVDVYEQRDFTTGKIRVRNSLRDIADGLVRWRNDYCGHITDEALNMSSEEFSSKVLYPVECFTNKMKYSPCDEVAVAAEELYDKIMAAKGIIIEKRQRKSIAKNKAEQVDAKIDSKKELPVLKKLNETASTALNEAQVAELVSNFRIVIDSTVLKDQEFSGYIRNSKFIDLMKSSKPGEKSKMYMVTRATRRELRNGYEYFVSLETDEDNKYYVEREIRNIKAAFNWLKVAANKGIIAYYNGDIKHDDEDETIQELLEKVDGRRVCLFTKNSNIVNRVVSNGTENFIAARYEKGIFSLWEQTVKNLSVNKVKGLSKENNEKSSEITFKINGQNYNRNIVQKTLQETDYVFTSTGMPIRLNKLIGEGGEGKVFEASHGYAAKIYHEEKLIGKEEKIRTMLDMNIHTEGICWPIDIVYDREGAFRGYFMPLVSGCMELGCSVMKLGTPSVAKKYMPTWNRRDLVKVARSIMQKFKDLHGHGILMGDVNPRNIMIDTTNTDRVWLVDCDSYQFDKYRCPVGTPIFTSPRIYEIYGDKPNYRKVIRTANDEKYAMASLLFQILMLGKSPFAATGSSSKNIVSSIKKHIFPYSKITYEKVGSGIYPMIWNNMPFKLKESFEKVFVHEDYLYDGQWIELLETYIISMEKGYLTDELFPREYKSTEAGQFKQFICTECGETGNMRAELYNRIVEKASEKKEKPQLYCSACENFHNYLKRQPIELRCDRCGRSFKSNRYWEMMRLRYNWRVICDNCKGR